MVPKQLVPGYPNTPGFRKVVKATIFIKKKEGLSDEDFIEYYYNEHAQKAVPVLQRHSIISRSLIYYLSRDRKVIQYIMHNNAHPAPYDALSTFVFPDYFALAKFLYDKDGAALTGDHDNFLDASQIRMMVGDK